jgi:glycosyltransferase involved in cell wall biosynthesis
MKILFVHQNFPGQFLHLAPELQRRGHQCLALTVEENKRQTPIPTARYTHKAPKADPAACRLGRTYTEMTDRGVSAARAAVTLRRKHGFMPDVIFGHSGWGETLFLHDVWPEARLMIYAEFFYQAHGADVGFDPEFSPPTLDQAMITTARAGHLGLAMLQADAALSPTRWQASTFPAHLKPIIEVIFDGVDTKVLRPDPAAAVTLPDGTVLRAGDEVLTFINRNLEPYRGYHIFMRALPAVMAARPGARVVIVGGDDVSYGAKPKQGGTWKDLFLDEVRDRVDLSRIHFTGRIPYPTFVGLMQVSRVHAYLTYPFVLSWSLLESMAAGAFIVGSRTAPVAELIEDGVTGRLVDFFDVPGWSAALIEGLAEPARFDPMRRAARARIVEGGYDLRSHCLPRLVEYVERVGAMGPRRPFRG